MALNDVEFLEFLRNFWVPLDFVCIDELHPAPYATFPTFSAHYAILFPAATTEIWGSGTTGVRTYLWE